MPSTSQMKPVNESLPEGFAPGDRDVVIGKGKKYFKHNGNRYLRTLVASMMDEYGLALTKPDKSNIITKVVEIVRKGGSFVKKDAVTGKWVYAEDLLCREKCSQTFRDCLHQTYRSSNVAKKTKRRRDIEHHSNASEAECQEDEFEGLIDFQANKRTRYNPMPSLAAPCAIPDHLFEWEMSPVTPATNKVSRRSSGLNGNIMSVLVDAFDSTTLLGKNDFENPFEPTPLAVRDNRTLCYSSQPQQQQQQHSGMNAHAQYKSFSLDSSFQSQCRQSQSRRNSIYFGDDISVMSDLDGDEEVYSCFQYQYQYQNQQTALDEDIEFPVLSAGAYAA